MTKPAGHRKFLSLARLFDGPDVALAVALGTSASTVSRLRAGKIQKMDNYIEALEKRVGGQVSRYDHVLEDLGIWSRESNELRDMLIALHRIALESS